MENKNGTLVTIERNRNLINDILKNGSDLKYNEENKNISASRITFGNKDVAGSNSYLKSTVKFYGVESNIEQSKKDEQQKEDNKNSEVDKKKDLKNFRMKIGDKEIKTQQQLMKAFFNNKQGQKENETQKKATEGIDEIIKKLKEISEKQQKDQAKTTDNNLNNQEKNKEDNDKTADFLANVRQKIKDAREGKDNKLKYCIKLTDEIFAPHEEENKENINEAEKLMHYMNIFKIRKNEQIKDIKDKTRLVELYNAIFIQMFTGHYYGFITNTKLINELVFFNNTKEIYSNDFGKFVHNFENHFIFNNLIKIDQLLKDGAIFENSLNNYIKSALKDYRAYQGQHPEIKNEENREIEDINILSSLNGNRKKEEELKQQEKKENEQKKEENNKIIIQDMDKNEFGGEENNDEKSNNKNFFTKPWKESTTGEKVGFIFAQMGLFLLTGSLFTICYLIHKFIKNGCACYSKESVNTIEGNKKI